MTAPISSEDLVSHLRAYLAEAGVDLAGVDTDRPPTVRFRLVWQAFMAFLQAPVLDFEHESGDLFLLEIIAQASPSAPNLGMARNLYYEDGGYGPDVRMELTVALPTARLEEFNGACAIPSDATMKPRDLHPAAEYLYNIDAVVTLMMIYRAS